MYIVRRNYQTRQQLRQLPEHLFQDINQTHADIMREQHKNGLFHMLTECLQYLIKGV